MRKEKFRHGDVVRIAEDLGPAMAHFSGKGQRAIVLGSYRDQFGGENTTDYSLFIEGQGQSSWYYDHQLTFIEHNPALLDTWEDQEAARQRELSSIPWIVEHWSELRDGISSTSAMAVFNAIGFSTSFSRNGEYYCLWSDWWDAFPFIDVLMRSKTIEEFRGNQNPDANQKIVREAEAMWRKLHEKTPVAEPGLPNNQ